MNYGKDMCSRKDVYNLIYRLRQKSTHTLKQQNLVLYLNPIEGRC